MNTFLKKLKLKLHGRDIQAVLDTVIRYGYYLPSSRIGFVPRMRIALINAEASNVITAKERDKTSKAISLYLNDNATLARALLKSGLPCGYCDCLSLYSNWRNRPELK